MVIVDDNSPDGTGDVAEGLVHQGDVKVVRRSRKLGLGSAVMDGFRTARGEVLGVMDADLSHPPALLGNDIEIEATPLEAAVSIRRPELMGLLFEHGARPSPADWLRLRCSAQAREYADVVATLDTRRPDGVEIRCSGSESLW